MEKYQALKMEARVRAEVVQEMKKQFIDIEQDYRSVKHQFIDIEQDYRSVKT